MDVKLLETVFIKNAFNRRDRTMKKYLKKIRKESIKILLLHRISNSI